MAAGTQVLQQSLAMLHSIHKDLDFLETLLSHQLGPICIPNCGACCHETLIVPQISAIWIASGIQTLPNDKQRMLVDRLEKWLLTDVPEVRQQFSDDGKEEQKLRRREYEAVGYGLWCPFLGDKQKCLVYPWRDVVCRAWGLTQPVWTKCPRPIYEGETKDKRKYIKGVDLSRQQITSLKNFLNENLPDGLQTSFLPTLVYRLLKPKEASKLYPRIQQAKRQLFNSNHLWLLTKEELDKHKKEWEAVTPK